MLLGGGGAFGSGRLGISSMSPTYHLENRRMSTDRLESGSARLTASSRRSQRSSSMRMRRNGVPSAAMSSSPVTVLLTAMVILSWRQAVATVCLPVSLRLRYNGAGRVPARPVATGEVILTPRHVMYVTSCAQASHREMHVQDRRRWMPEMEVR